MTEVTSTAAAAPPPDLARGTPGEYLRRLREEKGHTHAAVGAALHLTVHYIKALEGDEYGKLPGLTFVKGYLRSYARFLGADVDNVLASFDEHIAGLLDAGMHTARVERSRRRQDQALRWAIGAGFVVVVGLAAGWWFMRDTAAPAPATAQRAAPVQEDAAGVPPAATSAPPVASTAPATTFATAGGPVQPQASTAYMPASQPAMLGPVARNLIPNPAVVMEGAGTRTAGLGPAPAGTETDTAANLAAAPTDIPAAATITSLVANAVASAAAPTGTVSVPPATALDTGTTTATGTATAATPAAPGVRQIALIGAGNDELKVSFHGNSWIEVDDGNMVRLYNDMLSTGDTLTIRGVAPFRVLLGDAARVAVSFNASPVDISADIRADSTARLVLGGPAGQPREATSPVATPGTPSPAVQPASDEVRP